MEPIPGTRGAPTDQRSSCSSERSRPHTNSSCTSRDSEPAAPEPSPPVGEGARIALERLAPIALARRRVRPAVPDTSAGPLPIRAVGVEFRGPVPRCPSRIRACLGGCGERAPGGPPTKPPTAGAPRYAASPMPGARSRRRPPGRAGYVGGALTNPAGRRSIFAGPAPRHELPGRVRGAARGPGGLPVPMCPPGPSLRDRVGLGARRHRALRASVRTALSRGPTPSSATSADDLQGLLRVSPEPVPPAVSFSPTPGT